jgi:hypothetical protein
MSASIDSAMMWRMWSAELPMPSLPMDSWLGQAIFLSATMMGAPSSPWSRSAHWVMILSDSAISSSRIRKRP